MKPPFPSLILELALACSLGFVAPGALAIPSSSPTIPNAELLQLIEGGQSVLVVERLSQALAREPGNIEMANQLAVVLAGLGQTDRARQVLEQALLAHPQASSGFQSLRSIAASQFAESYAKAMGKPAPSDSRLALSALDLSTDQVRRASQVAKDREDERLRLAAAESRQKMAEAPRATRRPATVAEGSANVQIEQRLMAWARAWSKTDFDAYAEFYAASFQTSEHRSRSDWLKFRKPRIVNKPSIRVELSQVSVQMQGAGKAEVRFLQRYEAGAIKLAARKTQSWVLEDGQWQIRSEGN